MAAAGTVWFLAEINNKIFVDFHTTVFDITVDHQHHTALGANFWIKLIVPGREERGGDVKPLAVEGELDHLRAPGDLAAVHHRRPAQEAAHPDLARELGIVRVGDVVLADVAVQPVAEIEEAVVHRQIDVCDQGRHRLEALEDRRQEVGVGRLGGDLYHLLDRPLAAVAVPGPDRRRARADPPERAGRRGWRSRSSCRRRPCRP